MKHVEEKRNNDNSMLSHVWKIQQQKQKSSADLLIIYRGWSLMNEIEFVSEIVESHELALKKIDDDEKCENRHQQQAQEIVKMIPLNQKDFVSVDQGSFSVIHGLQYLHWL